MHGTPRMARGLLSYGVSGSKRVRYHTGYLQYRNRTCDPHLIHFSGIRMSSLKGDLTSRHFIGGACWIAAIILLGCPALRAQETVTEEETVAEESDQQGEYVPAIEVLPESLAGLVRVPNLPRFCVAWEKTHFGKLMQDESMQPYIDSQRDRAINYLESFGNKVGLRPQDLYDIASGEVVLAWLPFENDKRRPFALCVVADIRGLKNKADEAVAKIDQDLVAGGWVRTDSEHRGEKVRVYNNKPKPGQLKVEQISITWNESRMIAADRDTVVTDLLDAIAGEAKSPSISTVQDFKTVLTRSGKAIQKPVVQGGGIISGEWFARPFQMGRILRESLEIDRGNDVDILKLLENQGFDALKAAGGVFSIAGDKYDVLHRGCILAPAVTDEPSRYEMAARMLQFPNVQVGKIPSWIHGDAASFNRLNLLIEEAFWSSESLVNEALGDEIFRDIIDGIRDDEDGPQIDIAKDVLPNLDNQVLVITDNTLPTDLRSERMLVAIKVSQPDVLKSAIRNVMEVEPDATLIEELPGTEIWRVERSEDEEDFDSELFQDLELGLEEETIEEGPPLLAHWAIAVVDKGDGSDSPYLMFSNHSDLLLLIATRIKKGTGNGLADQQTIQQVIAGLKDLGCKEAAFDRAVKLKLSLRAKYELLRQGKLKDSKSVMASFYRRFLADDEAEDDDPLEVGTLPPLEKIEKYLPNGGSYFETTNDGWNMTGFLLK